MAEFMSETSCLSQTDNSSNVIGCQDELWSKIHRRLVRLLDRSLDCVWMKFPYERDWFLYFCKVSRMPIFLICLFQGGLDIKMVVSQICTDCFIEINTYTYTYTYIMSRLHKFDSQLQCTIELNK